MITTEEVEALALRAEKHARIAEFHGLPQLKRDWRALYTTLRALDAERRELRMRLVEADSAIDAAGEMVTELRIQLAKARNGALKKAANIADTYTCGGCGMDGKCGNEIRSLMTPEAKCG